MQAECSGPCGPENPRGPLRARGPQKPLLPRCPGGWAHKAELGASNGQFGWGWWRPPPLWCVWPVGVGPVHHSAPFLQATRPVG